MTVTINGTTGIASPDVDSTLNGLAYPDASSMGFRNRIINGDMRIDQRNAGAQISNPAGGVYTVDRWNFVGSQATKFNIKQNLNSVTPPSGFSNYLGFQVSNAVTVGATEYFFLGQAIEGFNTADLDFGKSTASSVTLSFWVRSSLTGSFGGSLQANGSLRAYAFGYTVNTANTWEQKTVTVPGDVTGTWVGATNGVGMNLYLGLGIGSNFTGAANTWSGSNTIVPTGTSSLVATAGATFYITGVQLEAGSVASPFERRDYGRELIMCQRYLPAFYGSNNLFLGMAGSTTICYPLVNFQTPARVSPTGVVVSSAAAFTFTDIIATSGTTSAIALNSAGTSSALLSVTCTSLTAGRPTLILANSATSNIYFTGCEL